jgi:enoyl-CoA hydratase/carnithine racemase
MTKMIEIRHDQGISQIYLNRPEKYNALNLEMVTELAMSLVKLAKDDSVRGVLITGSGRAFCAGGDLIRRGGFTMFWERQAAAPKRHGRTCKTSGFIRQSEVNNGNKYYWPFP